MGRIVRYARIMRYPDGGGLTAAERARREQVRFAAAEPASERATRTQAAPRRRSSRSDGRIGEGILAVGANGSPGRGCRF
jgi:hypothetical protein